ncbi:uncharacterized protein L969DRAFT_17071 [Mixia osmundae IAM 14324]|uniref:uncharacterized protein n=1 Tax=Mixia osmundae (strain CBS 9802 / IAM 14324 / JCM 22182 / KY 12970) TaxID=764103 RepID=UPI0004A55452|nr:uncharacterized protein L969DRAFT_17071 [Mixia osmundae IAM 14324]KEI40421.1 hypothetical protein L969DRAFT_17071 [Mixia osmundae IAM 14324]
MSSPLPPPPRRRLRVTPSGPVDIASRATPPGLPHSTSSPALLRANSSTSLTSLTRPGSAMSLASAPTTAPTGSTVSIASSPVSQPGGAARARQFIQRPYPSSTALSDPSYPVLPQRVYAPVTLTGNTSSGMSLLVPTASSSSPPGASAASSSTSPAPESAAPASAATAAVVKRKKKKKKIAITPEISQAVHNVGLPTQSVPMDLDPPATAPSPRPQPPLPPRRRSDTQLTRAPMASSASPSPGAASIPTRTRPATSASVTTSSPGRARSSGPAIVPLASAAYSSEAGQADEPPPPPWSAPDRELVWSSTEQPLTFDPQIPSEMTQVAPVRHDQANVAGVRLADAAELPSSPPPQFDSLPPSPVASRGPTPPPEARLPRDLDPSGLPVRDDATLSATEVSTMAVLAWEQDRLNGLPLEQRTQRERQRRRRSLDSFLESQRAAYYAFERAQERASIPHTESVATDQHPGEPPRQRQRLQLSEIDSRTTTDHEESHGSAAEEARLPGAFITRQPRARSSRLRAATHAAARSDPSIDDDVLVERLSNSLPSAPHPVVTQRVASLTDVSQAQAAPAAQASSRPLFGGSFFEEARYGPTSQHAVSGHQVEGVHPLDLSAVPQEEETLRSPSYLELHPGFSGPSLSDSLAEQGAPHLPTFVDKTLADKQPADPVVTHRANSLASTPEASEPSTDSESPSARSSTTPEDPVTAAVNNAGRLSADVHRYPVLGLQRAPSRAEQMAEGRRASMLLTRPLSTRRPRPPSRRWGMTFEQFERPVEQANPSLLSYIPSAERDSLPAPLQPRRLNALTESDTSLSDAPDHMELSGVQTLISRFEAVNAVRSSPAPTPPVWNRRHARNASARSSATVTASEPIQVTFAPPSHHPPPRPRGPRERPGSANDISAPVATRHITDEAMPTTELASMSLSEPLAAANSTARIASTNLRRQNSVAITDLDLLISRMDSNTDGSNYEQLLTLGEMIGDADVNRTDEAILYVAKIELGMRRRDAAGKVKQKLFCAGVRVNKCSICLVQFRPEELAAMLPSCTHVFHCGCVQKWLKRSHQCPVCRA